jgi:hypothetical protein
MINPFEPIQAAIWNTVTLTFGYAATWVPLSGLPPQTGMVLLKQPTQKEADEHNYSFTPFTYLLEFPAHTFPGLPDLVRQSSREVINVNGINYYARQIRATYDGLTIICICDMQP